jgi:hypothetical protein
MSATTLVSPQQVNVLSSPVPHGFDRATSTENGRVSTRNPRIDTAEIERAFKDAEREFMEAMKSYKAESGRMFPTWSEVLEVLRGLGYSKPSGPTPHAASPERAKFERGAAERA